MNNQEQRGSLYLWKICNLNLFSCKFQRCGEPCFYSVGLCGGFKMDAGNIAFMLICSALDDYELLEDLCEMDAGNVAKMSSMLNRLIGTEQKERLKEHLRTENGRVPMSKMMIEIEEIFKNAKAGKNS